MLSAVSRALQGLQYHQRDFARHAERISMWGRRSPGAPDNDDGVDLAAETVGLLQARRGYEANLPVLRTADEMIGTLLDVLA
jgi:hypothetical protein